MDSLIRAQMDASNDTLRRQLAYIADQLVSEAPGMDATVMGALEIAIVALETVIMALKTTGFALETAF